MYFTVLPFSDPELGFQREPMRTRPHLVRSQVQHFYRMFRGGPNAVYITLSSVSRKLAASPEVQQRADTTDSVIPRSVERGINPKRSRPLFSALPTQEAHEAENPQDVDSDGPMIADPDGLAMPPREEVYTSESDDDMGYGLFDEPDELALLGKTNTLVSGSQVAGGVNNCRLPSHRLVWLPTHWSSRFSRFMDPFKLFRTTAGQLALSPSPSTPALVRQMTLPLEINYDSMFREPPLAIENADKGFWGMEHEPFLGLRSSKVAAMSEGEEEGKAGVVSVSWIW
ncbi:hypothetical protein FIBSPDRAFT_960151 [Athelia psychrophila]|uniref:Uncharacterized protein n=1 Tax=Athelia psychrophila TaxID=1759441 RepID=A0A166CP22_9AGAM|nr:hypothetical protein FIBSPDRAFT_960151 [Fibularhizoctonia sp. CBS 109695]